MMTWKKSFLVGGPALVVLAAVWMWLASGCAGCEDGLCPDDPADCCSGRCELQYRGNPTAKDYCVQED